jgi:hypothetical protein
VRKHASFMRWLTVFFCSIFVAAQVLFGDRKAEIVEASFNLLVVKAPPRPDLVSTSRSSETRLLSQETQESSANPAEFSYAASSSDVTEDADEATVTVLVGNAAANGEIKFASEHVTFTYKTSLDEAVVTSTSTATTSSRTSTSTISQKK